MTHAGSAAPPGFSGTFRTDEAARAVYSEAAGIQRVVPHAVAVPSNADDLVHLTLWAAHERIQLTARGSGSSMAGGAIGPGVIVDMSRLKSIGSPAYTAGGLVVEVEPGVVLHDLNEAVREHGHWLPVDPSSARFCTIGGMVATNASGARTLRHGSIRKWVRSLDCVFADGSRAVLTRGERAPYVGPVRRFETKLKRDITRAHRAGLLRHAGVRKESSGYGLHYFAESGDLVDVIVGSEGTLAIILGIEIMLTPLPKHSASVLGAFMSLDAAVEGAAAAREAGAVSCELLDRTFLQVAREGSVHQRVERLARLAPETEAVLLAQVERDDVREVDAAATAIADGFRRASASDVMQAAGHAEQEELWELRHAASPVLARLDPALKSMQFIEDGAVPPERLAEYVRGARNALDRRGVRGVIFGHAGDGHVHVNPLIDVADSKWREHVVALLEEFTELTRTLGGTLAGEHGDGRIRAPIMRAMWTPEAARVFERTKECFDPAGILNPGVKVPLENREPGSGVPASASSFGEIKYDPDLAPLPPSARAALDLVVGRRAYSEDRLSLLSGDAGGA